MANNLPLFIIPDHGPFLARHIRALKPGIYRITITRARDQLTNPQRRYFHGVVLPLVAQGMRDVSGEEADLYDAKEMLRETFLMRDVADVNTGEVKWRQRRSTEELSKEEYAALIDNAIKLCAEWFGIAVPPPAMYYSDEDERKAG